MKELTNWLGKEKWDDAEFRNNKLSEWIKFAQKKYEEAEELSK